MSEKNDGIIISSRGVNGSTVYFIFTEKGKKPIINEGDLKNFSKSIIEKFPDYAKGVHKFWNSGFSGELPKEINLEHLERPHKARLIEQIGEVMTYSSTLSNKK